MQARRERTEEQLRLIQAGVRRRGATEDGEWLRWVVILPPATRIAQVAITSTVRDTERSGRPRD